MVTLNVTRSFTQSEPAAGRVTDFSTTDPQWHDRQPAAADDAMAQVDATEAQYDEAAAAAQYDEAAAAPQYDDAAFAFVGSVFPPTDYPGAHDTNMYSVEAEWGGEEEYEYEHYWAVVEGDGNRQKRRKRKHK